MDWSEYPKHPYYGQPRGCAASAAIFLLILAIFATSCKHIEYITVPELHTDTLYVSKTQHDSVYVKDSIYVHEWAKGDTVYVEKMQWQTRWRERVRTDTVYKSHTDSIRVPYPVEVVKTKTNYTGWFAFFGLLLTGAGSWFVWRKWGK